MQGGCELGGSRGPCVFGKIPGTIVSWEVRAGQRRRFCLGLDATRRTNEPASRGLACAAVERGHHLVLGLA